METRSIAQCTNRKELNNYSICQIDMLRLPENYVVSIWKYVNLEERL